MAEAAVTNASPLIFLSRGQHLNLLREFAARVYVPEPVAAEIHAKGRDDITAHVLTNTPWLEIVPAPPPAHAIVQWGLGVGESSVLSYAALNAGMEAVIDDLSARKCAASLGIPVRGTLGIVLAAKNRGMIPSARVVMEDLMRAGLYISRPVLDAALARVGE